MYVAVLVFLFVGKNILENHLTTVEMKQSIKVICCCHLLPLNIILSTLLTMLTTYNIHLCIYIYIYIYIYMYIYIYIYNIHSRIFK